MEHANILVVDDNPANLLALEALLAGLGENIVAAHSGEAALRFLLGQDVAVILLDVQMPGTDGFETATLIRQHARLQRTPIIFLTAIGTSDVHIFKGYMVGAVDYLVKPIVPEILRAKVSIFIELWHKTAQLQQQLEENKRLNHDVFEYQRLDEKHQQLLAQEQAARSQAEAMQRRMAFLADASHLLASSLDYETALKSLAQLAVPVLADWCSVHVLEADGYLRTVDNVSSRPERLVVLTELRDHYPFDPDAQRGIAAVLRTGETLFTPDVDMGIVQMYAKDSRHQELIAQLGVHSAMIVPLLARGRVFGAISLNLAETERRYMREDLAVAEELARRAAVAIDNARPYQQAQDAVRARDIFLSVAAHELRTPLTGLRGFAEATLRYISKQTAFDVERLHHSLKAINEQSIKLTTLIAQLLDITRLDAGKLPLERTPTDIVALVNAIATQWQERTTNHTITVHTPATLQADVDPLRLEQVLSNLVENAIKYSPTGGAIDIEVTVSTADTVCLAVTDHGIRIPPEHRPHIFDRFYQVNARSYVGGMGLGLYISRQIVELHGGTIEAEFPPDAGTRFVIRLPIDSSTHPTQFTSPTSSG
jgi:signal transduction histidine kinase